MNEPHNLETANDEASSDENAEGWQSLMILENEAPISSPNKCHQCGRVFYRNHRHNCAEKIVCNIFKEASFEIWDYLTYAKFFKLRIEEESITDFILMRMLRKNNIRIHCQRISKGEENHFFADWIFVLDSHFYEFQIQAKRMSIISSPRLSYRSLDERIKQASGSPILQLKGLILDAYSQTPPRIPLVAFYNHWEPSQEPHAPNRPFVESSAAYSCNPTTCPYSSKERSSPEFYSCTISSAENIYDITNDIIPSKRFEDLIHYMYPLSCLSCCRQVDNSQSIVTRLQTSETKKQRLTFFTNDFSVI